MSDASVSWIQQHPLINTNAADMSPSVAVDLTGNVYVAYKSLGTVSGGTFSGVSGSDIVVFKMDFNGAVVWIKETALMNTDTYDYSPAIAVDTSGNVYVSYQTLGTVSGGTRMDVENIENMCVFKMDTDGNVVWIKETALMNTDTDDYYPTISVDALGNVYVSYQTLGTVSGGTRMGLAGTDNICVFKMDTNGAMVWIKETSLMNTGAEEYYPTVTADSIGNVYVSYQTLGTVSGGLVLNGDYNIVVFKLDTNGAMVWIKETSLMNTSFYDQRAVIVVDISGNVYVAYQTLGTVSGGTRLDAGATNNICVFKMNAGGNVVWIKETAAMNTMYDEFVPKIALDPKGNVYVSYQTLGTVSSGTLSDAAGDIVIFKMDTNGGLLWIKEQVLMNTSGADTVPVIAVTQAGAIYVSYQTLGTVRGGTNVGGTTDDIVILQMLQTPDAPTEVSAVAGNAQVTVSFTASTITGGSEITSYTATSSSGNFHVSSAASPITVTGLINGTPYTFTVRATTSLGQGAASAASASVTPITVSGAPTSPLATATGAPGVATVSWTAPASNGGSAIRKYTVTSNPAGYAVDISGAAMFTASVIGLVDGTAYTFTVVATNAAGQSAASVPTAPIVTPNGVPINSIVISGTAAQGQLLTLAQAIRNYVGQLSYQWKACTDAAGTLSTDISGATGTTYVIAAAQSGLYIKVAVSYIDTNYSTPRTVTSAATSVVIGVPGAPIDITVLASNTQAIVSFIAPASNGGSVITRYTVTSSPGGLFAIGTASPITITGLTNGTTYTFAVTATNAVGAGVASSYIGQSTAQTPEAPTAVSATYGNAQAIVSFTAPTVTDGSVITSYTVTSLPGNFYTSSTASPITVTGLANGTPYTFTVTATTSVGQGAASAASASVTPVVVAGVPSAPTALVATPSNGALSIAFVTPTTVGDSEITDYKYSTNGGATYLSAGVVASPILIPGLTNGTTYMILVNAVNSTGDGAVATTPAATPCTAPGAPTSPTVAAYGVAQTAIVSWAAPAYNGGSTITKYTVTSNPAAYVADIFGAAMMSATATGLIDGTPYTFMVTATNAAGQGAASVPTASVTPNGLPTGGVTIYGAATQGATLTMTQTIGDPDGRGTLAYQWKACIDAAGVSSTNISGATGTTFIITSAQTDLYIKVTVSYTDLKGASEAVTSAVTSRVIGAPGTPTGVTVLATNTQAVVSFTVPVSNGGSVITSYTVTSSPGGLVATGAASPITATGLKNGTAYTFTVAATNAYGAGIASSPVGQLTAYLSWIKQTALMNTSAADSTPSVAVDPNGNVYVSYQTVETVSGGVNSGSNDIVVFKMDANGAVVWIKEQALMNTTLADTNPTIALDSAGNVYVSYYTIGAVSGGTNSGDYDIVVFKMDTNGAMQWIKEQAVMNTTLTDYFPTIAVDPAGNVYVSYWSNGTVSGGTNLGHHDIIVFKLDTYGAVVWIKQTALMNTTLTDYFPTIAVDPAGNVYVSYFTYGPVSGGTYLGDADIIVFKLDTDGAMVWIKETVQMNTIHTDYFPKIAVDSMENVYVTYPSYGTVSGGTNLGILDIVVFKLDIDGAMVWIKETALMNTTAWEYSPNIAVGSAGNVYVSYLTTGTASGGASAGLSHTVILKMDTNGAVIWIKEQAVMNTNAFDARNAVDDTPGIAVTQAGVIYVSYHTTGTVSGGTNNGGATTDIVVFQMLQTPEAPTAVSAVAGNAQATVSFTAPTVTGGSAVTSYTATSSPGNFYTSSTASPITVTGLANGTPYTFTVTATTSVGQGAASAASASVTPVVAPGVPSAPTALVATPSNGALSIAFVTQTTVGDSEITDYKYSTNGGSTYVSAGVVASPIVIHGLTNGTTYMILIKAVNSTGDGAAATTLAITQCVVPGVPTSSTAAVYGVAQTAIVSWAAPAYNGGSAIIKYTVRSNPADYMADIFDTTTMSATATGLIDGTPYTFMVTATNAAGQGADSVPTAFVTPNGLPTGAVIIYGAAIQGVTLTTTQTISDPDGRGALAYQWKACTDAAGVSYTNISGATSTTFTPTHAQTGLYIKVTVSYTDLKGKSEAVTSAVTSSVIGVPDAPTSPTAAVYGVAQTAIVSWTAPAYNGGSAIIRYRVSSNPAAYAAYIFGAAMTATATGLIDGTPYKFTVAATNIAGQGAASVFTAFVTPNGLPTGVVMIYGAAIQGVTLTTTHTIGDPDGLGTLAYQWKASTDAAGVSSTDISGATDTSFTPTSAQTGLYIKVTVSYTDLKGASEAVTSAVTSSVIGVPGTPTGIIVSAANTQAVVSFTAPVTNGSAITSYTATSSPGGLVATGAASPLTVTGLTNGTAYTFTVSAGNEYGDGIVSNPVGQLAAYLSWIKQLAPINTTGADTVPSVAVDSAGDVYVAYQSAGTVSGGANSGNDDIVVFKMDATGAVVWIKEQDVMNTTASDTNPTIAVDSAGNVYVSYKSYGTVSGGTKIDSAGTYNICVFKMDANGAVVWIKEQDVMSTTASDTNPTIAVDSAGNVYVSYQTLGTVSGGTKMDSAGTYNICVFKMDTSGNMVWIKETAIMSTNVSDYNPTIAVDISGNVYFSYHTNGTVSGGVLISGGYDIVVSKLDTNGNLVWIKEQAVMNTSAWDTFPTIAVDPSGNVYVSYQSYGTVSGGTRMDDVSIYNICVFKLYANGAVAWIKEQALMNTNSSDTNPKIAVDSTGNIYISYQTLGTVSGGALSDAAGDIVIFKMDANGGLLWIKEQAQTNTSGADTAPAIAVTKAGVIYVSYQTTGTVIGGTNMGGATSDIVIFQMLQTPDAPTEVSARTVNTQAFVYFTAPTITGGSAITSYTATSSPGNFYASSAASPITVTGLTAGTSYMFTVTATTSAGQGVSSTQMAPNTAPTGTVTITGTPTQSHTLTARNTLADAEGLGASFSYQWESCTDASGILSVDISGAIGQTFVLTEAQVNKYIKVCVSYTDSHGTIETVTSTVTGAIANVNDPRTGTVAIVGAPVQGLTLTAVSTLSDADGIGTLTYHWYSCADILGVVSVTAIGTNSATFVLTQAQLGKYIKVSVSYIDGHGTKEPITSVVTSTPVRANNLPSGSVAITGTGAATQGQTLTANTSAIGDADGPTTNIFAYQWYSCTDAAGTSSTAILDASGNTFAPTQAQVGKYIKVTVSYTDSNGTTEAVTSAATAAVANVNDAPTGAVTIVGNPINGQLLTANTSTIVDADGPTTIPFAYQWEVCIDALGISSTAISGATGASFALTDAQYGNYIKVTVSYTDASGAQESRTSAPTTVVVVGPPSAPTIKSCVAGNAQVVVKWTAPVNTGGEAIARYTVTSSAEHVASTTDATTMSITMQDLTNETGYAFTVKAITATSLEGALSAPSPSITPTANISFPTDLEYSVSDVSGATSQGIVNDGSIIMSYIIPHVAGEPQLRTYSLSTKREGSSTTYTATSTAIADVAAVSFNVTGLTNDSSGHLYCGADGRTYIKCLYNKTNLLAPIVFSSPQAQFTVPTTVVQITKV